MLQYKYEDLISRAFGNCGKNNDPLKLANADKFSALSSNDDITLGEHWIFGISYAIKKVQIDNDPSNLNLYSLLEALDKRLWKCKKVSDVITILDEATSIFDEYKVGSKSLHY